MRKGFGDGWKIKERRTDRTNHANKKSISIEHVPKAVIDDSHKLSEQQARFASILEFVADDCDSESGLLVDEIAQTPARYTAKPLT